jgi:hypothetical protein
MDELEENGRTHAGVIRGIPLIFFENLWLVKYCYLIEKKS